MVLEEFKDELKKRLDAFAPEPCGKPDREPESFAEWMVLLLDETGDLEEVGDILLAEGEEDEADFG